MRPGSARELRLGHARGHRADRHPGAADTGGLTGAQGDRLAVRPELVERFPLSWTGRGFSLWYRSCLFAVVLSRSRSGGQPSPPPWEIRMTT